MEWEKCPPYLSVSTHNHLFASKHDVGGPLQAKDRNIIIYFNSLEWRKEVGVNVLLL